MPLDRSSNKPQNASADALMAMNAVMRKRLALLQTYVDVEGERWVHSVSMVVYDQESAMQAVSTYDQTWFDSLLWSSKVKIQAATALISATKPYAMIDTHTWQHIAGVTAA